eukprot:3539090-Alexandrium_andersonii.AAC.1
MQLSPEACSARNFKVQPKHMPAPRVPSTRVSEHARAQHAVDNWQDLNNTRRTPGGCRSWALQRK